MFNYDQLANLVQSILTAAFGAAVAHGWLTGNSATLWGGIIGNAITFWVTHHSNATPAASSQTGANPAKAPSTQQTLPLLVLLLSGVLLSGCVSGGSSKVTAGVWNNGMGWKQVTVGTNGIAATNGFNFHFPMPLTNFIPLLMEAGAAGL